MANRPCGACRNPTPEFLLVNNDGLCNSCREAVDKVVDEKRKRDAYEYLEIDRRIYRSVKGKKNGKNKNQNNR